MARPTGPAPMPTELRRLHGTTAPSKLNTDQVMSPETEPDVPDRIKDNLEARRVWERLTGDLRIMGLLSGCDLDHLATYCTIVVVMERVQKIVLESPTFVIDGRTGEPRPNPALRELRELAATLNRFGTEFGLTPSSRVRIRMKQADPKAGTQETRKDAGRLFG